MSPLSIRARLTIWYLGALAFALITLSVGSWWLFHRSIVAAADESLLARIDGVHRYIVSMQRALAPEDLKDELAEYSQLSAGDPLLEIVDETGSALYRPALADWADVRIDPPASPAIAFTDRTAAGRPFRVAAATIPAGPHRYRVVAAVPMGPADAAWARFGWLLALLLPVLGLVAGAGGYWISGRALAPVDRMTRAVQAISLRNLDRRLDVPPAHDELRRLAVTFNEMLARLQTAVADMVRFTAEASHELRTPVSLMRATAEVTLAQPRTRDEYRDVLLDLLGQTERLSVLVANLLALARADAGVESPDVSDVDLSAIAVAATREVQPALEQRELTLDLELKGAPVIRGTAESLRRLLLIVLDNAIKYTPPGGILRVLVGTADAAAGRDAFVEITDTGPGIDPAERPYVFDRFYRGAAARADGDGSGLGLSLAQTIVERHGGSIALAAGPGGRGCRVRITLPAVAIEASSPSVQDRTLV